jgi:hypothetical protein
MKFGTPNKELINTYIIIYITVPVYWPGGMRERDSLEDLGVDGKIISKRA